MASFGETLRRERELRNIELREIAEATKISVRFLEALERERWEILPGGVFPRAFVRQYARYLGLDAERVVAEFVYAQGGGVGQEKAPRTPMRERAHPGALLLLGLVAVVGALALAKAGPSRQSREAPPLSPLPAAVPPADRVYPPPAAEQRLASGGLVLVLSASASCWVQAKVDGQTVVDRVFEEGQTQTFQARGEIILSVGNAGGVSFTLNDRPGMPLGRSGEVRRNIVITPQSLPSLVEDSAPIRASRSS
jgi:cytoskeletal protein RodZ